MKKAGADEIVSPTLPGGMHRLRRCSGAPRRFLPTKCSSRKRTCGSRKSPLPAAFIPKPLDSLLLRSADYVLIAVCRARNGAWHFNPPDFLYSSPVSSSSLASPAGRQPIETLLIDTLG